VRAASAEVDRTIRTERVREARWCGLLVCECLENIALPTTLISGSLKGLTHSEIIWLILAYLKRRGQVKLSLRRADG
jgi:hypothetical protein